MLNKPACREELDQIFPPAQKPKEEQGQVYDRI